MNTNTKKAALCAFLLSSASFFSSDASAVGDDKRARTIDVEEINDLNANKPDDDDRRATQLKDAGLDLAGWPAASRRAAADTIARYGQPDDVTEDKLIWRDTGNFKKIMVSRELTSHRFPVPHADVLTYVVDYRVPASRFDDLAMFDGSVTANRTKGELGAHCDQHEMNMAALNLADDIITGKKTVAQARAALAYIQKRVAVNDPPPTATKLHFDPTKVATADPDQPANRAMGR